ncbi:putative F-box/FBD/LRR-repeat protein At5g22670 [Vigna unguiculata]|uniref:putative F-box/FBD/LRR-repeat protein At5g22670 n=1 Tax=Vigna unguiculata TaxID=3917 RepID=UPI0010167525|nr:putative F-box/FBD/LRR-repeat protein At5g22670 [Vigna unguiculata]
MAEPSAKILRQTLEETLNGEADNIDRLSALPESVLLSILSRLELKEAAATSVLSTAWRDLFLQLRHIQLTFNGNGHPRLFHLFTLFVNRMLRERNPKVPIRVIRLTVRNFTEMMKPDYKSLMMSTGAAMSACNVKTIDYTIGNCSVTTEASSIPLPPAMFISETLSGLRLLLPEGWNLPEKVWLPKLRYVHFIPFRLVDENCVQRFLDGCPRLENMMLVIKDEIKVKTLCMSSSIMKFVILGWDLIDESETSITVKSESLLRLTLSLKGAHKVNLDAPNLKFFSIKGQAVELNMIQSVPSIEEAVIAADCMFQFSDWTVFYSRCDKVCTFFGELQNLTLLHISEPIMKALYISRPVMPTFRNMYKIKLVPDYSNEEFTRYWVANVLFNLFQRCPNLKVLSFEKVFDNYFGDVDLESVFPISMVQNLKELEIFDFKGREIEYKLVEFFMNNGSSLVIVSLRKDVLTPKTYTWTRRQQKRILSFLTCSEECKVLFR